MGSDTTDRSLHALEFFEVLSYLAGFAVSIDGHKACLALRPYTSIDKIYKESILFEQGCLWLERTGVLLHSYPPVGEALRGTSCVCYTPDTLWALQQVLQQVAFLRESIFANEEVWTIFSEHARSILFPSHSFSALNRCLTDDGLFKDSASAELALVRSGLRTLHRQCSRNVKEYVAENNITHFLQDDFVTLSSDRYVLPLKTSFKGKLQGIVHDYSQTGETCYFEPMFLVEINNRLQELKRAEREEEHKILLYLSGVVQDELPFILATHSFLVDVDVLRARMLLGKCYNGRLIELKEHGHVFLKDATHPLLKLSSSTAALAALAIFYKREQKDAQHECKVSSISAVPSTLELKEGQKALIISGGNAGGKTVALKTLGLTALMSQCILPCPVGRGSNLPFWKNIYAFIGDEQSIEEHVSTFTAQITNLVRVWDSLGYEDLVILDEFGAGTDPSQGAALAQAVIDCIILRQAFVIAATHFPALKAYALSTDNVRSASVLFDPKTKKPLFRLVYEQVGASQALDVAREHGLAEEVLAKASQYLLLTGEDTSALVERLNFLAVEREKEIEHLQKKKIAIEERRVQLQERFEKESARVFQAVQQEAQTIVSSWKAGRVSHKQALKELSLVRKQLQTNGRNDTISVPALVLDDLECGLFVRHIVWNKEGTIQEIDARKNRVRLNLDGVTLWAAISEITLPDKKLRPDTLNSGVFIKKNDEVTSLHLDLRGKHADVAINELEKFLDTAILHGRYEVEVVHGKGTGALRRQLHTFLKSFPAVAEFRLAPENRGGDGMTIVGLK